MSAAPRRCAAILALMTAGVVYGADVPDVQPNWSKPTLEVKTRLTMEVCVEPPMRRGVITHDPLFDTLGDLRADYARLAFWYPYPRLAVAELEPPTRGKTSWDFRLLDPIVADFLEAAKGRPVMVDIATIPQWMFKSAQPVRYPQNPDEITWNYSQGRELRDPSLREVREYFTRLVSWYTQGGFTDENGQRHESGHHYKIDAWEVLNEVDLEHEMSPQSYTGIYDEVVGALRQMNPQMKFSGPALAAPRLHPDFFEYFLDPTNHRPGIPIDMVSYHFYASPDADESAQVQQHTFFAQTDGFIATVRALEVIRKRLSPQTITYVNELGSTTADNILPPAPIPPSYWNLSGADFAYGYLELARLQIELIAGAELINYPRQFPGASLTDWNTGLPNARYRVLKLLRDQISPGDRMVEDTDSTPALHRKQLYAMQGFIASDGSRKILIINKRAKPLRLTIADGGGATVDYVDLQTGSRPPASRKLGGDSLELNGFAVAVVHLRR